ncbi:unnamed protein product [Brugia timori]|uniref:PDZ GRASP-type domain-containing protein n=1 Tax=Brugia timori TaxID=42155 RepID=A0A0R3QFB5_9BILA|nr:unnamed protein product [Brugia timori]
MGNSGSTNIPGGGTEGYHVLRVQENSPGQAAGLEPFFDFIVCIGNTRLVINDFTSIFLLLLYCNVTFHEKRLRANTARL